MWVLSSASDVMPHGWLLLSAYSGGKTQDFGLQIALTRLGSKTGNQGGRREPWQVKNFKRNLAEGKMSKEDG